MLRVSGRMRDVTGAYTLSLKAEAERLQSAGQSIIDLGDEEPDFPTPDTVKEAGKRSIDEDFTHYTDHQGLYDLRKSIAARYAKDYGTDYLEGEVIVTSGARNALFALVLALSGEGDEVIIISPHWSSYPEQVKIAGAKPVFVKTDKDERFIPRAETLEDVITPATRAVILNSPCNPSGGIIPADVLKKIIVLSLRKDFYLLCDESYESFVYEGSHVSMAPFFQKVRDRLVIVNSLSMTHGMGGWRVGFAIGPKSVIDAAGKIISHDSFQPSSISQKAALEAMKISPPPSSMLRIFRERRDAMFERLESIRGISCHMPEGAFYHFPDVTELCRMLKVESSLEASNFLFRKARVITVPGEVFGTPGHIRFSFATSLENILEGMKRIRECISFRT